MDMEKVTKLIEEVQKMKNESMNMYLYGDDAIPEEYVNMMNSMSNLMDLACDVMYDQSKTLHDINTKLDMLLAK